MAIRACKSPMCRELVRGQSAYCTIHKPPPRPRNNDYSHMYRTKLWKQLRSYHLKQYPMCMACELYTGWPTPGDHVDHIIPHKGDYNLFNDVDNLQTLCHSCHSRKTNHEMNGIFYDFRRNIITTIHSDKVECIISSV